MNKLIDVIPDPVLKAGVPGLAAFGILILSACGDDPNKYDQDTMDSARLEMAAEESYDRALRTQDAEVFDRLDMYVQGFGAPCVNKLLSVLELQKTDSESFTNHSGVVLVSSECGAQGGVVDDKRYWQLIDDFKREVGDRIWPVMEAGFVGIDDYEISEDELPLLSDHIAGKLADSYRTFEVENWLDDQQAE